MTDAAKTPTVYNIPAENLPGLMAKLASLSKKAERHTGKGITLNVLREVQTPLFEIKGSQKVPVRDYDGNQIINISYDVTIGAEVPKIEGWAFLATIDHSMAEGNIIRVIPNANFVVPEKYRTIEARCDHCNLARDRKDTFLLRCIATDEVQQIGRNCLRAFIGFDCEAMVAYAEILNDAVPGEGDEDDWMGGGFAKDAHYIKVSTFVAHAAAMIRVAGFVGRKEADEGRRSTAFVTLDNMFPPRVRPKDFKVIPVVDKDIALANEALEWAKIQGGDNEYLYTLSVLAKAEFIARRSIGFLASLIPAYLNAMKREFMRVERRKALKLEDSQFVGKLKERLRDIPCVLFGYRVIESFYGVSVLFLFQTEDGNVLKWFTNAGAAEKVDLSMWDATHRTPVVITAATVKKHEPYEGVKQTELSRCLITVNRPVEESEEIEEEAV